jgi:hypothetical protein
MEKCPQSSLARQIPTNFLHQRREKIHSAAVTADDDFSQSPESAWHIYPKMVSVCTISAEFNYGPAFGINYEPALFQVRDTRMRRHQPADSGDPATI